MWIKDANEKSQAELVSFVELSKQVMGSSEIRGKVENFENMIEKFVNIYSVEVMTFSAKVVFDS